MPKISVKILETSRAGEKWHKSVILFTVFLYLDIAKHQNVESAPVDRVASTWC